MANKFTIRSISNFKIRFKRYELLSYELLFSKENIHMFYLLNFGIFLYFHYKSSLLKETNIVKNWPLPSNPLQMNFSERMLYHGQYIFSKMITDSQFNLTTF